MFTSLGREAGTPDWGRREGAFAAGGAADDPAASTFASVRPHERIDYVFASQDVEVVESRTVTTEAAVRASDHLPVFALLRVE